MRVPSFPWILLYEHSWSKHNLVATRSNNGQPTPVTMAAAETHFRMSDSVMTILAVTHQPNPLTTLPYAPPINHAAAHQTKLLAPQHYPPSIIQAPPNWTIFQKNCSHSSLMLLNTKLNPIHLNPIVYRSSSPLHTKLSLLPPNPRYHPSPIQGQRERNPKHCIPSSAPSMFLLGYANRPLCSPTIHHPPSK